MEDPTILGPFRLPVRQVGSTTAIGVLLDRSNAFLAIGRTIWALPCKCRFRDLSQWSPAQRDPFYRPPPHLLSHIEGTLSVTQPIYFLPNVPAAKVCDPMTGKLDRKILAANGPWLKSFADVTAAECSCQDTLKGGPGNLTRLHFVLPDSDRATFRNCLATFQTARPGLNSAAIGLDTRQRTRPRKAT